MRPKGRGRPQRILLGTWPEEHIRGVIRAVVFRDTQTKDDMPFVFNRVTFSVFCIYVFVSLSVIPFQEVILEMLILRVEP